MLILIKRFFYLYFFLPVYLLAAGGDSSAVSSPSHSSTRYAYQNQFEFADSLNYVESSLDNFQNYLPFNHLGNSGLAYNDLFYKPNGNAESFGFNYFKNNYSNYFFSPQKIKFYNTRTPYTDIFYATGTKKEQVFKLTFSYNIKKNWNTTFQFNRIRSDGFYARQNTNDNSVAVSTNYKSLNNRYYLLAAIIYNNANNAENGGLRSGAPVGTIYLDSAKRITNQKSVFLKQYFNIGKKSTDSANLNVILQPSSRFILTSLFENNILKYQDSRPVSDSLFYENIYYDSTKTRDSAFNYKIDNELAWKRLDNNKHRGFIDILGTSFSVKHQYVELKQKSSLFIFNNFIVGSELYNTYTKNKCWWNVAGKYMLSGYNKNNYIVSAVLKKALKDSLSYIVLNAQTNSQAPDFIYNHFYSNNFFWNNNFSPTISTSAGASMVFKKYKFSFGADYSLYKNVLYFDENALAAQSTSTIPVFHAFVKKDFRFYKWHLNNTINYQSVPDSAVIRLPVLVLEHALYYANSLFKKVLNLQIGATVYYLTSYYANEYMPVTGQFYLQNTTLCGNYPVINFFINAQVKTVRVFFKIDNLNAGLMPNNGLIPNNYVLTPNYQMNGRAFKFGFSWLFFD